MMSERDRTNREERLPRGTIVTVEARNEKCSGVRDGKPLGGADATVPRQAPALHEKGKKRAMQFAEPFGPKIGIPK